MLEKLTKLSNILDMKNMYEISDQIEKILLRFSQRFSRKPTNLFVGGIENIF